MTQLGVKIRLIMKRFTVAKIFVSIAFLWCIGCTKEKVLKISDANGVLRYEWFFVTDTLTGRKVTYWPNGKVKEIHNYDKGRLNGEYLGYYENGDIARSCNFYKGIIRGPSLKYFENGKRLVETEKYFLDVKGTQYGYYYKVFDKTGNLVNEDRTVRIDYDCDEEPTSAIVNFVDHFTYDSVFVIVAKFGPDFSLSQNEMVDTIRAANLPISIPLRHSSSNGHVLRGQCIFFTGLNERDTSLVNVKNRWFEDSVPNNCYQ